jgi:hypothetical protein
MINRIEMVEMVGFARESPRMGVASCFFTLIAKNTKQRLAGGKAGLTAPVFSD